MEKHALETLIEIVDEHYQTDVKKNLGHQPSKEPVKKKGCSVVKLCSYFGYSRSSYYKSLEAKTTVTLQEDMVIRLVTGYQALSAQDRRKKAL